MVGCAAFAHHDRFYNNLQPDRQAPLSCCGSLCPSRYGGYVALEFLFQFDERIQQQSHHEFEPDF